MISKRPAFKCECGLNVTYLYCCSLISQVMTISNSHTRPLFAGILLFTLTFAVPAVSAAQQIEIQFEETLQPAKRFSGVEVSGVTEICEGSETALKVEGEYESYQWSNGEIGRTIKVQRAGVYEVTVKTKGGCTLTTSVNVTIKPCT